MGWVGITAGSKILISTVGTSFHPALLGGTKHVAPEARGGVECDQVCYWIWRSAAFDAVGPFGRARAEDDFRHPRDKLRVCRGLGQRWTHGATKSAGVNFNSTITDVKISWGNAFAFSTGVDLTERWWLGLSYGYAFNDVTWSATNATSRNRFNGKLATESLLLLVNYKLRLGQIKSVGRFSVKAKLGGGVAVSKLSRISEYLQNSAVKAATIEDGRMIRPMALGSLAFVYHPSKKISVSAGMDLNLSGGFQSGRLRRSEGGSTSQIGRHRFNPVSGLNL